MKPIKWASVFATMLSVSLGSFVSSAQAARSCEAWVAKVVAVEGSVQARKSGETEWLDVELNDIYCANDMLAVNSYSRAAILLRNGAVLRLDQDTAVTFKAPEKERVSWVDFLRGAIHFFSRIPRSLTVTTPFVNAAVEGTEFFVRVEHDQTSLSVFTGRVSAVNDFGSLVLENGQSAEAQTGKAPVLKVVVRPRDAVQWALYYPPVLEEARQGPIHELAAAPPPSPPLAEELRGDGRQTPQASRRPEHPAASADAHALSLHAARLLAVGRVAEATTALDQALRSEPASSDAYALQAIIAVVQNEKARALQLAGRAVDLNGRSAAAAIALSYAQQASFDLPGATRSLQTAVHNAPQNALALARLAELWLSQGYLDRAEEEARRAASLNPYLGRTQTVLGFAYLTRIKTEESRKAFEQAIEFEQGDPLPRLGLGLAKIRDGDLKGGRQEIEIAADLAPNNSLVRSYMGKAYYEEKRGRLASDQFAIAKELDPKDPTPWFYDAIEKQSRNRPVEALEALQKSIELNDNRAVYRSRLLLDDDLAARSASLARIYDNLGFQQLALVEGWKSVNTNPADFSAHRFLADSYAALPRHEIARVSELLQSQLLQPININPIQPQLAQSKLFAVTGTGPSDPSFNEFNPLFNRNRLALLLSGVAGEKDTFGDGLVQSGVWGGFSYSIGQYHYQTNGFRPNNAIDQDIYDVFTQLSLTPQTSAQMEYRRIDLDRGDLRQFFFPSRLRDRLEQQTDAVRFGLHHAFSPSSDLLVSTSYLTGDSQDPGTIIGQTGYGVEAQHLFHNERFSLVAGVGHFNSDIDKRNLDPQAGESTTSTDHTNLYAYWQIHSPQDVTWTLGGSADFFEHSSLRVDRQQFNPKLGITWNPFPDTTVRAAAFRVLKRTLLFDQTLEPTQVAGFNQFFDDGNAADAWHYGVGLDQKLTARLYAGVELSRRDLSNVGRRGPSVIEGDSEEDLIRGYLYWAPHPWLALGPEYQFEHFQNPKNFMLQNLARVDTHRFGLGLSFFHPSGFMAWLRPAYLFQEGEFFDLNGRGRNPTRSGEDNFFVLDASIGYRLPNRWGIITLEARNLFDESFRFQDTDPANPTISPDRVVMLRFTLEF
jgi:tetratricopeptide (TPR) repeat protein